MDPPNLFFAGARKAKVGQKFLVATPPTIGKALQLQGSSSSGGRI